MQIQDSLGGFNSLRDRTPGCSVLQLPTPYKGGSARSVREGAAPQLTPAGVRCGAKTTAGATGRGPRDRFQRNRPGQEAGSAVSHVPPCALTRHACSMFFPQRGNSTARVRPASVSLTSIVRPACGPRPVRARCCFRHRRAVDHTCARSGGAAGGGVAGAVEKRRAHEWCACTCRAAKKATQSGDGALATLPCPQPRVRRPCWGGLPRPLTAKARRSCRPCVADPFLAAASGLPTAPPVPWPRNNSPNSL
eukprot:gene24861-biopygen16459